MPRETPASGGSQLRLNWTDQITIDLGPGNKTACFQVVDIFRSGLACSSHGRNFMKLKNIYGSRVILLWIKITWQFSAFSAFLSRSGEQCFNLSRVWELDCRGERRLLRSGRPGLSDSEISVDLVSGYNFMLADTGCRLPVGSIIPSHRRMRYVTESD